MILISGRGGGDGGSGSGGGSDGRSKRRCISIEDAKTDKTRNSGGKIFVKQFHSNTGKSTFSNRVITNWNNLPAAPKFANSIILLKNLLDNDLKFKVQFRSFDK